MPTQLIKEKFSEFYVGDKELVTGYRWCDDPPMYILNNGYLADGPIPKENMLHEQADDDTIRMFLESASWRRPHYVSYFLNLIDHGNPYDRLSNKETRWCAPKDCNVRLPDGTSIGHAYSITDFQRVCTEVYKDKHRLTFSANDKGYYAFDFAHRFTFKRDDGQYEERNSPVISCLFNDEFVEEMPDEDDGKD